MALINENDEASARDSLGGLPKVVLNFLALRLVTAPNLANTIIVQYGVSFQDSLGGLFIWNPTDVSADNGSTIIKPASVATGRWNLLLAQGQAPSGLVAGLGQGARLVTAGTVITSADRGKIVGSQNGNGTVTFTAALGAGFVVAIAHLGNTNVDLTIDNGSGQIVYPSSYPAAATTLVLKPYESVILMCLSGSNVWMVVGGTGLPIKPTAVVDKVFALSDGATIATDASLGNIADVTIAASRIMGAPTNPSAQKMVWRITQGGAGSNLITWNPVFDFGAAGAPTLSTAVGKTDLIAGVYNTTALKWQMIPASLGFN